MTMQGQGESQPGESVDALDDLADALTGEQEGAEADADPDASEGDEDEQEVDSEEEADEEESVKKKFTIKHDGKDVDLELTPAEEAAMLQQSYDYTKKTMAVAEERKAVESEKAQVAEIRQYHTQAHEAAIARLEAISTFLHGQLGDPPAVDLIHNYGAEYYLAEKEKHEARKGQLHQALAGVEQLRGEQNRQRQSVLTAQAAETIKELKNTLPGWNEKTLPELEAYVEKHGITLASADVGYVQKGLWEMAHKAKAYDAIQARKAEMKPTTQLTKVNRPAAANSTGKVADRAKREAAFNKNPSVDSLADFLR